MACIPKDIPNKLCFFRTVSSRGRVKGAWNVKFDVLPINQNVIENISRVKLHVLEPGEEEVVLSRKNQVRESESSSSDDDSSMGDIFPSLSTLEVTTVKSYTMKVGDTAMDWEVLLDGEHITEEENPMYLLDKLEFRGVDPDFV
jgi:hypothetical protein